MKPEKQHAFLCIGGPYDGRRYTAKHDCFKVAQIEDAPLRAFPPDDALFVNPTSNIREITYVADCIRFHNDKEVWSWRPYDQSRPDTLLKLLERYEQSSNLKWA